MSCSPTRSPRTCDSGSPASSSHAPAARSTWKCAMGSVPSTREIRTCARSGFASSKKHPCTQQPGSVRSSSTAPSAARRSTACCTSPSARKSRSWRSR
jgi:hypothetical protein